MVTDTWIELGLISTMRRLTGCPCWSSICGSTLMLFCPLLKADSSTRACTMAISRMVWLGPTTWTDCGEYCGGLDRYPGGVWYAMTRTRTILVAWRSKLRLIEDGVTERTSTPEGRPAT